MDSRSIKSSKLKFLVDLLQPTTTQDAANADVTTFAIAAAGTVYAEIEQAGAKEHYAGNAKQNEKRIRVKIYHRTDVAENWKLTWRGETYEIHGIDTIEPNKGLVLNCVRDL